MRFWMPGRLMPIRTAAPRRSTVIFAFGLSGISDIIISSDEDPAPELLPSARATVVVRADKPARPPSAAAKNSRLSVLIWASISISYHLPECGLAHADAVSAEIYARRAKPWPKETFSPGNS